MEVSALSSETLFRESPTLVVAVDNQGLITFFSPAAAKATGVAVDDALGQTLAPLIPFALFSAVLQTGISLSGQEIAINSPEGRRDFLVDCSPIMEDNSVVGAVGVFHNVSQLDALSCKLRDCQGMMAELDAIINAFSDGIFITNAQGTVLEVNRAYENITGLRKEEVMGRKIEDLVAAGIFTHSVTMAAIAGKQAASNIRLSRTENLLMTTAIPVFNPQGNLFRIVVTVRDMTELNRLRCELEKSRAITRHYQTELRRLTNQFQAEGMIAHAKEMLLTLDMATRVAQFDSTVLLMGESGVGKDFLAKFIHKTSPRRDKPFIQINCAAIPESLLESELFGYTAGAFTGASKGGKKGLFEAADKGTLLLDEVGELPLPLQVKLLRVLQERQVMRLGATLTKPVDVRVIAATNRDLEHFVEQGNFRRDLYFRLNVVPITVPPLRRRKEDIIPLVYHFRRRFQDRYHLTKEFAPEVYDWFLKYRWPGNIRELENLLERLMVTTPGEVVQLKDLPHQKAIASDRALVVNHLLPWKESFKEMEKQLLSLAVEQGGNITQAARLLGIDVSTASRKWQRVQNQAHQPD